jgi:phosphoenolpyruvate---glycerone phosphotransferase subunit DhaL
LDATQATSDVVREMAAAMEENRRYLTKLDSEIGDGDHGNNMNRGFQAALVWKAPTLRPLPMY